MHDLVLTATARKAMASLPEGVVAAVWEFMNGPLRENPRRVGKPLTRQLRGHYSARRGEYRVIYSIDDDRVLVTVVALGHRRSVYRAGR